MGQGIELRHPARQPVGGRQWWQWVKTLLSPAGPGLVSCSNPETGMIPKTMPNSAQNPGSTTPLPTKMPDWWSVIQRYSRLSAGDQLPVREQVRILPAGAADS
jgi:hypothetical protein